MIITRMREYLEEHGWYQGDLYEDYYSPSPVCLQGAFYRTNPDNRWVDVASRKIAGAIRELYPDFTPPSFRGFGDWNLIVSFNDDEHTTFEDIMRVLKHAEQEGT